MSVVPEATGPRGVKEGVAYTRCPVLESPPPPALLPLSQQPGHCLRPPPQPSAAAVAARGIQVQCTESPVALLPLGSGASHTTAAEAPAGAEDSQVLSSGGGRQVGTDVPCSSGAGLSAPRCWPLRALWGAWALRSACTSLGSPGAASSPRLCRPFVPRPLLLAPPGGPCLVAANTGGGDPDSRALLTPPRVGNQTF